MAEMIDDVRHLRQPRGIASLWLAMLSGPVAWMLGLTAQYNLVRVACAKQNMLYLHGVSVVTLLIAVGGGMLAWREWKRVGSEWPGEAPGPIARSRFMVAVGLLASALFTLAILSQWAANLFFNPCMAI
jgi:nicotinamide riboside transporter PnuC